MRNLKGRDGLMNIILDRIIGRAKHEYYVSLSVIVFYALWVTLYPSVYFRNNDTKIYFKNSSLSLAAVFWWPD